MSKFKKLSEGDKIAFCQEFLGRFKLVKKLKPDLDEEKDVLEVVADKYYGGDILVVEDAIRYIESKTNLVSLETVQLDDLVEAYKEELDKKKEEASSKVKEKEAEIKKQEAELKKAKEEDGKAKRVEDRESARIKRHKIFKAVVYTGLVLTGLMLLGTFGGVVGLVNTAVAFVGNLSFVQMSTLVLLVYGAGTSLGLIKGKSAPLFDAKGKFKDFRKKRREKRDGRFSKAKEDFSKANAHTKELNENIKKSKAELEALKQEEGKIVAHKENEARKLKSYEEMRNFSKGLSIASINLKEQFNIVNAKLTTDQDRQDLLGWYKHFAGALYYGAYRGLINTKEDMARLVVEAKQKFEQVADPLKMNRAYTASNVKSRTDENTNKPLEEMFESV